MAAGAVIYVVQNFLLLVTFYQYGKFIIIVHVETIVNCSFVTVLSTIPSL
jgi:hypothetical protein